MQQPDLNQPKFTRNVAFFLDTNPSNKKWTLVFLGHRFIACLHEDNFEQIGG
jgi:hypothetical protein